MLIMLALGFSSGLPFLLVGNTLRLLAARRRHHADGHRLHFLGRHRLFAEIPLGAAPGPADVPVLELLGQRRGWMLLAQIIVGGGLARDGARWAPRTAWRMLGACALVVAFAAATQDIAIDAWRIESASDPDELGLLTSAYTFGYRVALLGTEAVILLIAQRIGLDAVLYCLWRV